MSAMSQLWVSHLARPQPPNSPVAVPIPRFRAEDTGAHGLCNMSSRMNAKQGVDPAALALPRLPHELPPWALARWARPLRPLLPTSLGRASHQRGPGAERLLQGRTQVGAKAGDKDRGCVGCGSVGVGPLGLGGAGVEDTPSRGHTPPRSLPGAWPPPVLRTSLLLRTSLTTEKVW